MVSPGNSKEKDRQASTKQDKASKAKAITKKKPEPQTLREFNAQGKLPETFRRFSRQVTKWVERNRKARKDATWLPPYLKEDNFRYYKEASTFEAEKNDEPKWPPQWDIPENTSFRNTLRPTHDVRLEKLMKDGLYHEDETCASASSAAGSSSTSATPASEPAAADNKERHCGVQETRQSHAEEALKTKKREEQEAIAAKKRKEEEASRERGESAPQKEATQRDAEAAVALRKKEKEEEEKAARETAEAEAAQREAEAQKRQDEAEETRTRQVITECEEKEARFKAEADRQKEDASKREELAEATRLEKEAKTAEALRQRQQEDRERAGAEEQERARACELAEARAGKSLAADGTTESSRRTSDLGQHGVDGGRDLQPTSRSTIGALFNIASSVYKAATAPGEPATAQSNDETRTVPNEAKAIREAAREPVEQTQAPTENAIAEASHSTQQAEAAVHTRSKGAQLQAAATSVEKQGHDTQTRRASTTLDHTPSATHPGEQLFISAMRTALSRGDWEPGMGCV